jgi:hypothetical protein
MAVKKLKTIKPPGGDHIVNKYIKATISTFMPVYVELFNVIFERGIIPEEWLKRLVKPIYKGRGDSSNPETYRPITLLSCLGKFFTSILYNRVNAFADETKLINETQTGFRKGYCTIDNIFVLDFLSKYALNYKKKNILCFYRF